MNRLHIYLLAMTLIAISGCETNSKVSTETPKIENSSPHAAIDSFIVSGGLYEIYTAQSATFTVKVESVFQDAVYGTLTEDVLNGTQGVFGYRQIKGRRIAIQTKHIIAVIRIK
jgi:hypothetical protein